MDIETEDFKRRTYFENDNFRIYLEEIQGNVFVHVAIHNATVSVVKDIKEKWTEIVLRMYFLGYEELFAYTNDSRIIELIGGATKVADNIKFQNKNYEVWKWDLS